MYTYNTHYCTLTVVCSYHNKIKPLHFNSVKKSKNTIIEPLELCVCVAMLCTLLIALKYYYDIQNKKKRITVMNELNFN